MITFFAFFSPSKCVVFLTKQKSPSLTQVKSTRDFLVILIDIPSLEAQYSPSSIKRLYQFKIKKK